MLNLNSKLLEAVVCDSLDNHLHQHRILSSNQWAFQKGLSTESTLLYITETWKDALDNGFKIGVVFVDFKKAFDTIDHYILETKLSAAGISGDFQKWLTSYLTNRQQYVDLAGAKSSVRKVEVGVPQGSLLGPRLFTIYVNDLPEATTSGNIQMYADDTTIYYIGKEVEEIVDKLNRILKDLYDWCNRNKLTVHSGKTEAMLITRSGFIGPLRHLRYGEATISFTDSSTCLGIQIDNRLQWKKQVTATCKKYSAKLKFLKRLRNFPTSILEDIYYKGIIAGVTYCITVWGTTTVANFNQLEELHIKSSKIYT